METIIMSANPTAIGLFTADNIAAILGAIPDSNGTYADIAELATNRGADVSPRTLAKWIVRGRQDLERKKTTALARFAKLYDDRLNQHCGPDVNRHRELDRALFLLLRTCECGQEKDAPARRPHRRPVSPSARNSTALPGRTTGRRTSTPLNRKPLPTDFIPQPPRPD